MTSSPTLLQQVADRQFLHTAWRKVNRSNPYSKGLSNDTIYNFTNNLDSKISEISKELLNDTYRFSDTKGVLIEKGGNNSKLRPLRISEVKDRLVQKALTIMLDEVLTTEFCLDNDFSFAYRKGRNVEDAVKKMKNYYNDGYRYILEADIIKFFDNVDKNKLLQKVQAVLKDKSINRLLHSALTQKVGNTGSMSTKLYDEYFLSTENGIPQGNALSPLFANVYLSDFDRNIELAGYKMIRYADDFIIMCKSYEDTKKAHKLVEADLNSIGLQLHSLGDRKDPNAKTKIVLPSTDRFTFLSIQFDGEYFRVKKEKVNELKDKIVDITTGRRDASKSSVLERLKSLKNCLEGWFAAYSFTELDNIISDVDKVINVQLYRMMKNCGITFHKDSLDKISFRGKSNEVRALKSHTRKKLGIPSCNNILKKVKPKA